MFEDPSDRMASVDRAILRDIAERLEVIADAVASPNGTGGHSVGIGPNQSNSDILSTIMAVLENRRRRLKHFDPEFLGEPAWEMLLDLYINEQRGRDVSVSSACLASGAPSTTALRYVTMMTDRGWLLRVPDPTDKRKIYLKLSDRARSALIAWAASVR